MKFLVTGATGNVGGEVVDALLTDGHQVRALVRGERPAGLLAGAEAVRGDLNEPASLTDALAGVQGLFLLAGYADMAGIAAQAKASGVARIVLLSGSSAGGTDHDNAISAFMNLSEAAVRESGVAWTILRPFGFMSNALRWLDELKAGDVVREPFATVPVAMIDPFDIAAVAAAALTSAEHEGQTYVLTGPEPLLPADRLRILGEILGRAPRTFLDWASAHADAFR
jgi:uncharacterized protein YbjT (DUF2867 family)